MTQTFSAWAKRLAAAIGCLILFVSTAVTGEVVIPHSWQDFDDARVRMQVHIIRYHVYDTDFIWAAVAYGFSIVAVAMMFACFAWMLWIVVSSWEAWGAKAQRKK